MRKTVDWATPSPDEREAARWSPFSAAVAIRRVGSGVVLRALLFVAVFSLAAVPPLDPDLWWHLANGRLIVLTGSIPHADVYSFSAAGNPWVMHEWLADLGMYGLFRAGGLPLLVAIFALIVTAAAGCLYALLRRSGLHATAAAMLTLAGALAGSTAWGARPQLLNSLFVGLLLVGLLSYRDGRLSPWILPPFIWLWANLHSGFVVGLIISGLFVAAEAFDVWRGKPTAMPRARLSRLGLAGAISVPLAAVNPFGVQALLFAVGTLSSPLIQNNIQEWASPDFHTMPGLLFEGLLILIFAGLATRKVNLRSSEWLLALATLYLAFSSQRHVPLFVLAAAPLYGRCAQALLELIPRGARPGRRTSGEHSLALGLANLGLLLAVTVGMIAERALPNLTPAGEAAAIRGIEPVDATAALLQIGKPMHVFNYYDYGGYLAWMLYPHGGRVFIDGRVEVYGSAIFGNYLRVNYLAGGWPSVIAGIEPDAIIMPSSHPLIGLLKQDPGWHEFHRDGVATVFTRVGFGP